MTELFVLNWLASTPAYAAPLLLACLGLIVNERAGVLNLGAEGVMAVGALGGIVASVHGIAPVPAALAAAVSGAALAMLFGVATIVFRTDQVLTGLILVGLGVGLTGVVGRGYTQVPVAGFRPLDLDGAVAFPWVGPVLLRQDLLVYIAALLSLVVWWVLFRTVLGLRLRAVGEDPAAADVAGINVQVWRLAAVAIGGALCGLAGGYLSLAASHLWVEGMVGGRGWIAIALVIFAGWHPIRAAAGAILFGGLEALIPRIQATGADVPVYGLMMLPYLATLVVLGLPSLVKGVRSAAPAGLGLDYLRQDRR